MVEYQVSSGVLNVRTGAPDFLENAEEELLSHLNMLSRRDGGVLTVIWFWKFSNSQTPYISNPEVWYSDMGRLTRLRQSSPPRSSRIKFNVSRATDLSGVMDTLIFLMSSDAVGEINFASFHPGFILTGAWKFIGKTNVMINEKWKRKRKSGKKKNPAAI